MTLRRVWVVETLHHDPRLGWIAMGVDMERRSAWDRMGRYRAEYTGEKFRTVSYVPSDAGGENG